MRTTYIVTYDVRDPKRLRKTFKVCKAYGTHLQLSVFECDLSTADLVKLKGELNEIINNAEDQVLFVELPELHIARRDPYPAKNLNCSIRFQRI